MSDMDNHRFLIGTNSFKKENEIHLVNYSEDSNRIDQEAVFTFDNGNSELWCLSSSPYNRDIFAGGLHNIKDDTHYVQLFDMGDIKDSAKEFDRKTLKTKIELGKGSDVSHQSNIHSIIWEDTEVIEG